MVDLTIDQQRALALARAKARAIAARNANLEQEVLSKQPKTVMQETKAPSLLSPEIQSGMDKMHQIAPTTRFAPMVVGGVIEAGKGLAQTGAAVFDYFAGTDSAKAIEENVPELQSGDATVQVGQGAVSTGIGMAGPQKFIPGGGSYTGVTRLLANVGKFTAVNAGGVAAMDDDVLPMITGDNAELGKLLPGLSQDKDGNYSEELLKNKLNLLLDAAAISKAAETVGRTATGVSKWVFKDMIYDNLINWRSLDARKKQAVKDLVGELENFDPNASQMQREKQLVQLADRIDANADVFIPSGKEGVPDVSYQRPTAEAYIESGVGPAEKARAAGTQASVLSQGAPELEGAIAKPALELDRIGTQMSEAFGGKAGTEQARQKILQTGKEDIGNFRNEVSRQEGAIDSAKKDAQEVFRNDPYFGETVTDAEARGIDLSHTERLNQTTDKIVSKHNEAKGKRIEESNKLYKEVEESGVPANMDSWKKARAEVEEYIPNDIKNMMNEAEKEGTYGALKAKIVPELSAHIDDLYDQGQGRLARKFIKLRDNINKDQMASLVESENLGVATAAEKATKNFKENVAPFKQGTSDKLTELDNTLGTKRPDEAKVESRKALKGTFNDPDAAEHSKRVLELVDDADLKDQFVKQGLAEEFSDLIATEGIDKLSPVAIANKLRSNLPLMSPSQRIKAEKFLNSVEKRRGEIKGMEKTLDDTKGETEAFQKQMDKNELRHFKDADGLDNLDSEDVFGKYLSDKDGGNRLKNVLNRAKRAGDGTVEGLKSAWVRHFQKKSFRGGEGPAGQKNINAETRKAIDDGDNKAIEYGKMIFADEPDVVAMFDQLSKNAVKSESIRSAPKVTFGPLNKADLQARGVIDFAITQTFGALNRWGARLRSATGRAISSYSANQITQDAKAFVMSNPREAAKLIREMATAEGAKFDKTAKKRLYQYMVQNGIYNYSREDEEAFSNDVDEQTKDATKK